MWKKIGRGWLACVLVVACLPGCGLFDDDGPDGDDKDSIRLGVPFIAQQTQVWCWAATSEMVVKHVRGPTAPSQCQMLSAWFQGDCCSFPQLCAVAAPNLQVIQQTLYGAGGVTSQLRGGPLTFAEAQAELDAGRPMIAAYAGAFNGHVVVIYGCDSGGNLYIHDPYYGSFTVPFHDSLTYGSVGNTLVWYDTIYGIRPL